jgi:hypothetical protein
VNGRGHKHTTYLSIPEGGLTLALACPESSRLLSLPAIHYGKYFLIVAFIALPFPLHKDGHVIIHPTTFFGVMIFRVEISPTHQASEFTSLVGENDLALGFVLGVSLRVCCNRRGHKQSRYQDN